MKEKIKTFLICFLTIAILTPLITSAWPGCCSHHGGVCGCHCCDGTSLSTTCAPHYPQCNSSSVSITAPQTTKYSIPIITEPNSLQTTVSQSNHSSKSYIWWWVIGGGLIGIMLYAFKHKK